MTPAGYTGDTAFTAFLNRIECPAPFHVVRMRFLGAIASPADDILPVPVIQSLWPEDDQLDLATMDDAKTFFDSFIGLWNRQAKPEGSSQVRLTRFKTPRTSKDVEQCLLTRLEEIEDGFVEGFWAGHDDLDMSAAAAGLIDLVSETAGQYAELTNAVRDLGKLSQKGAKDLSQAISEYDGVAERAMTELLRLRRQSRRQN
jgi:hypothetical protein